MHGGRDGAQVPTGDHRLESAQVCSSVNVAHEKFPVDFHNISLDSHIVIYTLCLVKLGLGNNYPNNLDPTHACLTTYGSSGKSKK